MMSLFRLALATALVAFIAPQATAEDAPQPAPFADESALPQATMPGNGSLDTASVATQPVVPYSWDTSSAEQPATLWAPDESQRPNMLLSVYAPALLIVLLTIFGLIFTFRCLLADSRRNRIHYRTRGPGASDRTVQQAR